MATTCPRCGGVLERYDLRGHEQFGCADCGYVGVPVDHVSDGDASESWGDAVKRFQATGDQSLGEREHRDDPATVPEVPEDADASPTVEVVSLPSDPPGSGPEAPGEAPTAGGGADDDRASDAGSDEDDPPSDGSEESAETAGSESPDRDGTDDESEDSNGRRSRRRRKKRREQ